ncbi:MAG: DUF4389 domain-containing protein [Pseudomonadota bacterium]
MTDTTAKAELGGGSEAGQHLRDRSTWMRLVYMLILALAWTIAEIVFVAVVVLQFLSKLFTGEPIDNLTNFGRSLAEYMAQIVRFQTFVTEDLAFPFVPWPSVPKRRPPRRAA